MSLLLLFLSAGLLWAAFPPVGLGALAFVALIPLFMVLDKVDSWRAAFGRAYLTGFMFFMAVLAWLRFVSMFGEWLAWLGLVLLSLYLALYIGAFGAAYYYFRRSPVFVLAAAASWTVLEYIRGTFLTGFTWGALGHTQGGTPLAAIAAFTGVAGISFLIVAGNLLLKNAAGEIFVTRRAGRGCLLLAAGVLGGAIITFPFVPTSAAPGGRPIGVAVIQPNILLEDNWDPRRREIIVRRALALSRQALASPLAGKMSVIVWPETAFPAFYDEQPALWNEVRAFAREHGTPLLIGTVKRQGGKYYNAAILIDANGVERQWVAKRHLVIFGEYIPLRDMLPFLSLIAPIDDFTPGPEDAIITLPDGTRAGILLCFEDTVPYLARRYASRGADILINMTNDAWFRNAGQQRMHLNNALFRAAENGLPMARSTNTGESCFIGRGGEVAPCVMDAEGRRIDTEGVALDILRAAGRHTTFYTKYGEVFTGACFAFIMTVMIIMAYRRRRVHA